MSMVLQPDSGVNYVIQEFFRTLYQSKPHYSYLNLWTRQDKKSAWFRDLTQAAEYAGSITDRDCHFGVGLGPRDEGPAKRCNSGDDFAIFHRSLP